MPITIEGSTQCVLLETSRVWGSGGQQGWRHPQDMVDGGRVFAVTRGHGELDGWA